MLPAFDDANDTRNDENSRAYISSYVSDEIEPSVSVNPMSKTMNINPSLVKPLGLN